MSEHNMDCCLLKTHQYSCRVSSVLDNNSKQYGKQFMFDACEDTCWNSKEGIPQWIQLQFEQEIIISQIELQFQGGFAGKEIQVFAGDELTFVETFYPEDINSSQCFSLPKTKTNKIKLIFPESTDFFGRIIIYKLCVR